VGYEANDKFENHDFYRGLLVMTWRVIEGVSRLLSVNDRAAVLGDLTEANESPWQMLVQVSGMVAHHQLALWKSWQPWLAGFGLALPASLFLMGMSVSLSSAFLQTHWQTVMGSHELTGLASVVFLLIACSWSAGFVVSFLSRRTLWVSGFCCVVPCIFCFLRFRTSSLSRFSLFLFLVPVLIGAWRGLRGVQISRMFVAGVAVAVTLLMIRTWSRDLWLCNVGLLWPIWYVVWVTSAKTTTEERVTS
jgi:hypothetical protein